MGGAALSCEQNPSPSSSMSRSKFQVQTHGIESWSKCKNPSSLTCANVMMTSFFFLCLEQYSYYLQLEHSSWTATTTSHLSTPMNVQVLFSAMEESESWATIALVGIPITALNCKRHNCNHFIIILALIWLLIELQKASTAIQAWMQPIFATGFALVEILVTRKFHTKILWPTQNFWLKNGEIKSSFLWNLQNYEISFSQEKLWVKSLSSVVYSVQVLLTSNGHVMWVLKFVCWQNV